MVPALSRRVANALLLSKTYSEAVSILASSIGWKGPEVVNELRSAKAPEIAHLIALIRIYTGSHDPTVPSAEYKEIGYAHRVRNRPDLAKVFYEYALENATSNEDAAAALNGLGILALDEGDLQAAERKLSQAHAKCSRSNLTGRLPVDVLLNQAWLASLRQEPARARELLAQASAAVQLHAPEKFPNVQLRLAQLDLEAGDMASTEQRLAAMSPQTLTPVAAAMYHELRERVFEADQGAAAELAEIRTLVRSSEAHSELLMDLRERISGGSIPPGQVLNCVLDQAATALSAGHGWQLMIALRKEALRRCDAMTVMRATVAMLHCWEGHGPNAIGPIEEALESALELSGPAANLCKLELCLKLGELYFGASRQSPELLSNAVAAWERGMQNADGLEQVRPDRVARLHAYLGIAYRRLNTESDSELSQRAIMHLKKAATLVPVTESQLKQAVEHDLVNATLDAHADTYIKQELGDVTPFREGVGRTMLERLRDSIQAQELLLAQGQDPLTLATGAFNVARGYRELANLDQEALRTAYLQRAANHAASAVERARLLQRPELVLAAVETELVVAFDSGLASVQLESLLRGLEIELKRCREVPEDVVARAAITAARVADALRQTGRAYRLLLRCLRQLSPLGAESGRVRSELGHYLLERGEPERALLFVAPSLAKLPSSLPVCLWPDCRRWRCEAGSTAILWHIRRSKEHQSWIVVVDETSVHARRADLQPEMIAQYSMRWHWALAQQRQAQTGDEHARTNWRSTATTVGRAVGDAFFRPVMDLLKESKALYVLPTLPVSGLPFHLAELEARDSSVGRLRDHCTMSYARSLGFYDRLRPSGSGVLAALHSPSSASLVFGALEIAGVSRTYGGDAKVVFDARSEDLLAGLTDCQVVHLACHGEFNRDEPLDSALMLADRVVSLREVELRLKESPCRLIVLAACEIGGAGLNPGRDGGFPSALLRAGCRSVVASFWRVDDLASSLLMLALHQAMASKRLSASRTGGASPSEALRYAQRWLGEANGPALAMLGMMCEPEAAEHSSSEQAAKVSSRLAELWNSPLPRPFEDVEFSGAFFVELDRVPGQGLMAKATMRYTISP